VKEFCAKRLLGDEVNRLHFEWSLEVFPKSEQVRKLKNSDAQINYLDSISAIWADALELLQP
jgi:hypothetical protein